MIRIALIAGALTAAGIVLSPTAAAAPFPNCTAARDAGYEDIPSDSPYYGPWLDSDGDGIGCES
ncbi:excalibur calcium-binding domain-containing protein [Mycolicibacterium austroafricanum]|uniref:Excalibur calcium-binding domain-containing protein n=1 Tax=Mycolicibacterium austroafricanum TaxID=39687 RepID=A0ABT8HAG0_MYCAO|nr:excalibur calcium-binding domain-containing protein [Mycolicibacterium austroafricanum]MDN4517262.1 excalibur calcium-binding domain-containing protein [Mycolicibacterium austroafricanum]